VLGTPATTLIVTFSVLTTSDQVGATSEPPPPSSPHAFPPSWNIDIGSLYALVPCVYDMAVRVCVSLPRGVLPTTPCQVQVVLRPLAPHAHTTRTHTTCTCGYAHSHTHTPCFCQAQSIVFAIEDNSPNFGPQYSPGVTSDVSSVDVQPAPKKGVSPRTLIRTLNAVLCACARRDRLSSADMSRDSRVPPAASCVRWAPHQSRCHHRHRCGGVGTYGCRPRACRARAQAQAAAPCESVRARPFHGCC
jgi:hypothetical protein